MVDWRLIFCLGSRPNPPTISISSGPNGTVILNYTFDTNMDLPDGVRSVFPVLCFNGFMLLLNPMNGIHSFIHSGHFYSALQVLYHSEALELCDLMTNRK